MQPTSAIQLQQQLHKGPQAAKIPAILENEQRLHNEHEYNKTVDIITAIYKMHIQNSWKNWFNPFQSIYDRL